MQLANVCRLHPFFRYKSVILGIADLQIAKRRKKEMKKRITRRILAGFLAFLMLFSTVTWDELAFASVAAETIENTENGDISDGDKEPVQVTV